MNLFEQISSYIGTFSIIQEELESLKQILNEKQEEIEKLQNHFESTNEKMVNFDLEESSGVRGRSTSPPNDDAAEDDLEEELKEILHLHSRTPSRQSMFSITHGEKQQLLAQNELLSTLLTEKEQELISFQQAEKAHDEALRTIEDFKRKLEDLRNENEMKGIELHDIRNILDEKLRENSSLKKEKILFIEKLSQFEREKQEEKLHFHASTGGTTSTSDEVLRLTELYNELNEKYHQLQIDYHSIQSLIQQKTDAYLQCQNELNQFQNLYSQQKKKLEEFDLFQRKLIEREKELEQLRIDQSDLQHQLEILKEKNDQCQLNHQNFDQIQLDLKRITQERDFAILEKKQLETHVELYRQKVCRTSTDSPTKIFLSSFIASTS